MKRIINKELERDIDTEYASVLKRAKEAGTIFSKSDSQYIDTAYSMLAKGLYLSPIQSKILRAITPIEGTVEAIR